MLHHHSFVPKWNEHPVIHPQSLDTEIVCCYLSGHESIAVPFIKAVQPNESVVIENDQSINKIVEILSLKNRPCLYFLSNQKTLSGDPYKSIVTLLNLVKACQSLLSLTLKVVVQQACPFGERSPVLYPFDALLLGFTQSVAKEFPMWQVSALSLDCASESHVNLVMSEDNTANPNFEPVVLWGGKRFLRTLSPTPEEEVVTKFKRKGHYLIVGGGQGIGHLLALYLAQTYEARLTLIGRRSSDLSLLDDIRKFGSQVDYLQVDITESEPLKKALSHLFDLDGVIHSALVLEDATISSMNTETLKRVLAPKVEGCLNLYESTKHCLGAFHLFFSSIQSFIANPGQANYSAACTFKDSWASHLRDVYMVDSRVVNWGFWGHVGVVAKEKYRKRMEKLEIGSIASEKGLSAIESLVGGEQTQVVEINASDTALQRLHIKGEEVLSQEDRNRELQRALESYSRASAAQITVPNVVLPRFERLVEAIKNIPLDQPLDKKGFLQKYPELKGHVTLLDQCIDNYSNILAGLVDPMGVLFPGGSFDLVKPVYRDNPIADYYNQKIADLVVSYQNTHGGKLRILEIGAGTGSTADVVLPLLSRENSEYVFTDVSLAFTKKAERRYSTTYPFVRCEVLDIEKGSTLSEFDIVIATNVLHATKDLDKTLGNVRQLLKNNGQLLLNEVTSRQDYATLTFGLTSGWWLYSDYRIPDSPLVSGDTWKHLLENAGFIDVIAHGGEEQQVLVATSEGNRVSKVEGVVTQIICDVMKMSASDIDREAPFSDYGIDSLIVLEILAPLQERFGYLPSTLLFEYPNLQKLSTYIESLDRITSEENFSQEKDQEGEILTFVRNAIASILHMNPDDLEIDQPFAEQGIDSLIVLEILKPLQERFGYLPSTILFEYPTLKKLSSYLEGMEISSNENSGDKEESSDNRPVQSQKIAVVGLALRAPMANDSFEFWKNLSDGKNCIQTVPESRWSKEDYEKSVSESYTHMGGFMEGIENFDTKFFQVTPKDAENLDPQERLFLEETYHAFEDAGIDPLKLENKQVGTFVGVMNGGYGWLGVSSGKDNGADSLYWSVANRISYHFNFTGPSLAVDTACSSSLSALHLACQSLRERECDIAVAGGVNLIVHPRQFTKLCRLKMLSKDGTCRSFGEGANGFVDGEGIVSLVLKPLDSAIESGDRIYGVICGSAINSGGKTAGFTVPNPDSQARVIASAFDKAGICGEDVDYVEAHGTGTELGDPIEIRGLTKAFKTEKRGFCALGSVKSSIGHLESAAGLVSLVKVLLQMDRKKLVPTIYSQPVNPHLRLDQTPFFLQTDCTDWKAKDRQIAAVSSFGAGGANAHVIVENKIIEQGSLSRNESLLIPISGKTEYSLQQNINRLRVWLKDHKVSLYDLGSTLSERHHYRYRRAFCVDSIDALQRALEYDLLEQVPNVGKRFFQESNEYESGNSIDWRNIYPKRKIISLPGYAFEENFCWIEKPNVGHSYRDRIFKQHSIGSTNILPAALSLSLMKEKIGSNEGIKDIIWIKPIDGLSSVEVLVIDEQIEIRSEGQVCVTAVRDSNISGKELPNIKYDRLVEKKQLYQLFASKGYTYGPLYQSLLWVKFGKDQARGAIYSDSSSPFSLDPTSIDAALQMAIPLLEEEDRESLFVPSRLNKMIAVQKKPQGLLYTHLLIREKTDQEIIQDYWITDLSGSVVFQLEGLVSRRISVPNNKRCYIKF